MLITINTDASYNDKLKIGAFSFWMVCDAGRHFGAGALKGTVHHSTEAEFKAILNALHFLKDKSGWKGISRIIINTDSQGAKYLINGSRPRKWSFELQKSFIHLKEQLRVPIEARKVKAHSGTDEKRNWVNSWCDRQAKKILQSIIKNQST